MMLNLNSCHGDKFLCADGGGCRDLSVRCDRSPDCPRYADEKSCSTLVEDSHYAKGKRPPNRAHVKNSLV